MATWCTIAASPQVVFRTCAFQVCHHYIINSITTCVNVLQSVTNKTLTKLYFFVAKSNIAKSMYHFLSKSKIVVNIYFELSIFYLLRILTNKLGYKFSQQYIYIYQYIDRGTTWMDHVQSKLIFEKKLNIKKHSKTKIKQTNEQKKNIKRE
jgi:hypothetical protein